jgi:hypothetical protein
MMLRLHMRIGLRIVWSMCLCGDTPSCVALVSAEMQGKRIVFSFIIRLASSAAISPD